MFIYEVRAQMHRGSNRPDTILFYDEDRETAVRFMKQYDKQHGFSIDTEIGTLSIATLLLVERELTGKVISTTKYCDIYDVFYNRIDKRKEV